MARSRSRSTRTRKSHKKSHRKSHRKSPKKSRRSRRVKTGLCAKWKKVDCGRTDASCGWTKRGCVSRRGSRSGLVYEGPVRPAQASY